MALPSNALFRRKANLLLVQGEQALDLSEFRFTFKTSQADLESPNTCEIRVYNVSKETMDKVQAEFSRVVVQAGYEGDTFGVIFDGTIRWWRKGKESSMKDTYLDILAADGDLPYNNAKVQKSLAAGSTVKDRLTVIESSFKELGLSIGYDGISAGDASALTRGKVMFGLAKTMMGTVTRTQKSTWSIQNGKINIIKLDSYMPGQVVVMNRDTGLIGRPEQTAEGIRVRHLLNPKLYCGGLVQIDNASINQTAAAQANKKASLAYNSWSEPSYVADVSADGYYRLYVVEHTGDTRGGDWYSDLTCLKADSVTRKVKPYG